MSDKFHTWAEIAEQIPQNLEEVEHIDEENSIWRFRCVDLHNMWFIYRGKKPENCAVFPVLSEAGNVCVRLTAYAIQAIEKLEEQRKNPHIYRNMPTRAQMLRELQRAIHRLEPETLEWPTVVTCVASGIRDIQWHLYTPDDTTRVDQAVGALLRYLSDE